MAKKGFEFNSFSFSYWVALEGKFEMTNNFFLKKNLEIKKSRVLLRFFCDVFFCFLWNTFFLFFSLPETFVAIFGRNTTGFLVVVGEV